MLDNVYRRTVMKAMGAAALLGLAGSGSADLGEARGSAEDIYGENGTGSFSVTIGNQTIDEWTSVTIPGEKTEQTEYREGSDPDHHRKLWGQTKYGDLTLERGMKPNEPTLWDWRTAVRQGKMEEARKTVTVTLQNSQGSNLEWEFTNAWPKEYDSLELQSGDYGETATEAVTIEFDEVLRRRV